MVGLRHFWGRGELDIRLTFEGGRFPNVVVALDGTVLALWQGVKVRRSADGGRAWGLKIMVGERFMGGGAIVNETNGEILKWVGN